MRTQKTIYGGPTWSDAHRHACEVRYVLALPGRLARRVHLDGIERRRGAVAADRLRADVAAAWRAARGAQQAAPAADALAVARVDTQPMLQGVLDV